jgi:hypothetical protein
LFNLLIVDGMLGAVGIVSDVSTDGGDVSVAGRIKEKSLPATLLFIFRVFPSVWRILN